MSKRKQRRGSNQRMVVNPYHRHHATWGTAYPAMPDPTLGLSSDVFDSASMKMVAYAPVVILLACIAAIMATLLGAYL